MLRSIEHCQLGSWTASIKVSISDYCSGSLYRCRLDAFFRQPFSGSPSLIMFSVHFLSTANYCELSLTRSLEKPVIFLSAFLLLLPFPISFFSDFKLF